MAGQFVNILKTFNEKGLIDTIVSMLKNNSQKQGEERFLRIGPNDAHLFSAIEKRIAKTQLVLWTKTRDGRLSEFSENILSFHMAMDAAKRHILNKASKTRHYSVYLTYEDDVEKSSYFTITVKNPKTNAAILTSCICNLV